MMKKLMMILGFVASTAFATEYPITNSFKVVMTATGDELTTATTAIPESLPDVATPIFRFDAKDTTDWTFDSADAKKITSIPSSVGDRTLTMDATGGDFTSFTLASPVLYTDPTLGNQPCVDFGAIGSKKGLLFNAVSSKNELSGIGSVFMVFNSEKGGGSLLGGGSGSNQGTANTYNMWLRGLTPNYPGSSWDSSNPYSFLLRYGSGAKGDDYADVQAAKGRVYHDGFVMTPISTGLIGGWEVVALQPLDNTLVATGVGLGHARGGFGNTSGGQRIAEMIVYGEVLSDADRAKVEAYLEKKWFGRDMRSWGSNAAVDIVRASKTKTEKYTTNGAEVEATVGAGENLNIGKLFGGRGGYATFTKNGEGSLAIGDASAYQGTVHANGGTLAFAKRPIPSALPAGYCADFDASDSSTITTYDEAETVEGISVKRVKKWTNKSDFKLNDYKICLAPDPSTAGDFSKRVPWVRANMLNGKAALDFGHDSDHLSGTHLVLVREDALTTNVKIQGVTTVLAVVSPHSGCPYNIVGAYDSADPAKASSLSYFNPTNHYHAWASPLFSETVLTYFNNKMSGANSITMWDNGIRHDHATGFAHPGWQVVAFANPGSQVGGVGMAAHYYYSAGDMCLAELVMYARPLTEQEILDAQAYLHYKWFGRETPGYAKVDERAAVPDVQKLAVDAASTIDVAAGTTVRVGTLSGTGVLTKTGAGTLEVEKESAAKIVLKGGTVKTVAAAEPVSFKTMAKDPATHFDASDDSAFITRYVNSRDQVWMWYDETGRNTAYRTYDEHTMQPWINRTDTLNGKQVVDFGAKNSTRHLNFAVPLDGVKAAFVVWGSQNGGGTLLGATTLHGWSNGDLDDFRRVDTAQVTDLILNENDTSQHVWGGKIFVNGVETAFNKAYPSGNWDLVEVYPLGAAHVSALAYGRSGSAPSGGQRLAEVILYERELSEREKVATRNYLMQKWFGKTDEELTPLPDAPAVEAIKIEKIDVAAGETVTLDEDADYEIGEITGAGDIVKNGTGDISIGPADGFTGNLQVNSGKLTLTAMPQPKLATDGLAMWLDATNVPASSITQEKGMNVVSNWVNQVAGSTLTARGHTYGDPTMTIPQYVANGGPNDSPYFYFPRGSYFRFKDNANNSYKRFTDIQTVFWVIGSQNGGGMLLGDSTAAGGGEGTPTFRRATGTQFPGDQKECALLTDAAQQEVREAAWKENGSAVDPMTDGLSGSWDIVSCNLQTNAANATSADGLAYVGGKWQSQYCCGFQNLAEVLIYNRRLSSSEVCEVESYLADKYALNVGRTEKSFTNGLKVTLAEGATLESTGRSRYVDGIESAGTVSGLITLGSIVANKDNYPLVIDGTLTIPEGIKVKVESLAGEWTPVVSATAYEGADNENLSTAKFSGSVPGNLRLRVRNGQLGVATAQGMIIIFR